MEYLRAKVLLGARAHIVILHLNSAPDGGLVVPVKVVKADHKGKEDEQEGHHELHHVLSAKGRRVS